MARVDIDGVRHSYDGTTWVLDGLDLVVESGEAHALLGPSGAGKTTLLNLLSGLLRPNAGRVRLDGRDVTALPPHGRNIAQVFQFPVLYPVMSVYENLAFPLRTRGIAADRVDGRVGVVAELLGLTAMLGRRPSRLSSYDKQKVALGRGLVRTDVGAVLLDEPLTAVEPAAKWQLRRALKGVQRELGLTMIYVTHDQLEALTFADRVSVIRDGRLLQSGSPEALVDDPAHTFIGHFIGSPGMNVIPAAVAGALAPRSDTRSLEIGFRPEAAEVVAQPAGNALAVRVESRDVLGTRDGVAWGVLTATLGGVTIRTRQRLDIEVPGPGWLVVDPARVRVFEHGWRVDA